MKLYVNYLFEFENIFMKHKLKFEVKKEKKSEVNLKLKLARKDTIQTKLTKVDGEETIQDEVLFLYVVVFNGRTFR